MIKVTMKYLTKFYNFKTFIAIKCILKTKCKNWLE